MPLIMQLERHLTNQGIQFSTDNALLWPESRAVHTLHFWGIPLSYHLAIPPFGCIRAWWLKKKDSSARTSKVRAFCFASEPNLPLSRCGQICRSFSRILISYGWRPALEINSWWTFVFRASLYLVISFRMKFYTSMKLSFGELEGFGEFKNWI